MSNEAVESKTLDEIVADRNRISAEIQARLVDHAQGTTVEQAKVVRQKVLESAFPEMIESMLRYLRMHSIGLVFHDGVIENGPVGLAPNIAVRKAVESGWENFPEAFRDKLADALFSSMFDIRLSAGKAPLARHSFEDPSSLPR
jgi:hypothetical protein